MRTTSNADAATVPMAMPAMTAGRDWLMDSVGLLESMDKEDNEDDEVVEEAADVNNSYTERYPDPPHASVALPLQATAQLFAAAT